MACDIRSVCHFAKVARMYGGFMLLCFMVWSEVCAWWTLVVSSTVRIVGAYARFVMFARWWYASNHTFLWGFMMQCIVMIMHVGHYGTYLVTSTIFGVFANWWRSSRVLLWILARLSLVLRRWDAVINNHKKSSGWHFGDLANVYM